MEDLIERLKQLEQLELPNGAKGAVWLDDVIDVIEKHLYDEDRTELGEKVLNIELINQIKKCKDNVIEDMEMCGYPMEAPLIHSLVDLVKLIDRL